MSEEPNVRYLNEFIVFSRHMNYSRAAQELYLSQPALSQHIAALEKSTGVELVQGDALTPAGKRFLAGAQRVVEGYERVVDEYCRLVESCRLTAMPVRVSRSKGSIAHWPSILRSAQVACSGDLGAHVTYELVAHDDETPIDALAHGTVDVAFMFHCMDEPSPDEATYVCVDLEPETLALMLRSDSPLAAQQAVHVEDLAGYRIPVGNTPAHRHWGSVVERLLAQNGTKASFVELPCDDFFDDFIYDIEDIAHLGHVSSFQNHRVDTYPDLVMRTVDDASLEIGVWVLCLRDNPNPAVGRFVEHIAAASRA